MRIANRLCLRVEELEGRLVPSTLAYSTNWAGYAVSTNAGAVSGVAGNWVVPAVSPTVSGYSSAWVGIDGYSSSTVEQIGTDSDYVNGMARYYAWYEFYPQASVIITALTVQPGDSISASVTALGSHQFNVSITDVTTSQSFSTTQTVSQAQQSSAEWIQEAPSSGGRVLPLANFGTINFSGANATVSGITGPADNSWAGSTLYQINMVTRQGSLKATTSALSDSGIPPTSNFSVTWVSSGSGGNGGGGHSTFGVPLPNPVAIASRLSAAVADVATSALGTAPALVTTPSTVTVASPVMAALSTLPAVCATFGTFGRGTANWGEPLADPANAPFRWDAAAPGKEVGDQTSPAELPSDAAVPVAPPTTSSTDGLPASQTYETPANLPGASLPLGALKGAVDGGYEARDTALAGLVLTLALERTRARAKHRQAIRGPWRRWPRMTVEPHP